MPSETSNQSPKQPDFHLRLRISKMMTPELWYVQVINAIPVMVVWSLSRQRTKSIKARSALLFLLGVVLVLLFPLPLAVVVHPSKHKLPVSSQRSTHDSLTTNVSAKAIQPSRPKLGPGVIVEFKEKHYDVDKGFDIHPFVIIEGPDEYGMVKLRLITSFGGRTPTEAISSPYDTRKPENYFRLPCVADSAKDAKAIEIELCNDKKMPKRCYIEFAEYTPKHHVHIDKLKMYHDEYIVCRDDSFKRLVQAIYMVAKSH